MVNKLDQTLLIPSLVPRVFFVLLIYVFFLYPTNWGHRILVKPSSVQQNASWKWGRLKSLPSSALYIHSSNLLSLDSTGKRNLFIRGLSVVHSDGCGPLIFPVQPAWCYLIWISWQHLKIRRFQKNQTHHFCVWKIISSDLKSQFLHGTLIL